MVYISSTIRTSLALTSKASVFTHAHMPVHVHSILYTTYLTRIPQSLLTPLFLAAPLGTACFFVGLFSGDGKARMTHLYLPYKC